MLKLFFSLTVISAFFLWYFHEYHTNKFFEVVDKIPYTASILNNLHFYWSIASPILSSKISKTKIFTSSELQEYNGEENSKGLYLAILGDVYDVEKGVRHYGPGGPYHVFAGKDASRSFVTGDFSDDQALDDVLDLSYNELLSIKDWCKFYKKEYDFKGKLAGRFYDEKGRTTEYWQKLQKKLIEAEKVKLNQKDEETLFPPCNVEWNAETGTKVWCTNKRYYHNWRKSNMHILIAY